MKKGLINLSNPQILFPRQANKMFHMRNYNIECLLTKIKNSKVQIIKYAEQKYFIVPNSDAAHYTKGVHGKIYLYLIYKKALLAIERIRLYIYSLLSVKNDFVLLICVVHAFIMCNGNPTKTESTFKEHVK